jgi:hypothetical protein
MPIGRERVNNGFAACGVGGGPFQDGILGGAIGVSLSPAVLDFAEEGVCAYESGCGWKPPPPRI